MKNDIYFAHIREGFKRPLTIAYMKSNNSNSIRFAVAQCSKRDQFCKKTGRAVSGGRLEAGKYLITTGAISLKHKEVIARIVSVIKEVLSHDH